jgi:glycerol kinase
MAYSYIVVVDQGTHSTRAIIYNTSGEAIFKSQQSIDLFYRDSLHIEQDGNQILSTCQAVLADAHEFISKNKLQQVAVALATQRSTVLAWDANTGDVITPALSWLDTRAQDELKDFPIDEAVIKEKTGLPLSPHYGASKLQWLLQHDENVQAAKQQKCLKFGPLAAYLIFNLVEQQPSYVDYSNAHRTLLWNLQTREWDDDLLAAFSIDAAQLPRPVPSAFDYGKVKKFGYPLILVNGDQNSAVYGYGKLDHDTSFVNMGTGAFVLANSHQQPVLNTKLLASITYSSDNKQEYALEGTVNGAGAAMTWAETEWNINDIEAISWKDVENVPVFLNTVGGLGSPFWKSDIQPRFLDAHKTHTDYSQQQCIAALMESIVFLLTINIEAMSKHDIKTEKLLIAGGMSKDRHLCQCLANLCSVSVIVSSFKEATSRGAAWLALQALNRQQPEWEIVERTEFKPMNDQNLQSRYEEFKKEIVRLIH